MANGRKDSVDNAVEIDFNLPDINNLTQVESENIRKSVNKEYDYVEVHAELNPWEAGSDLIEVNVDVDDTIGLIPTVYTKPLSFSDLYMNVANITKNDYKKASSTGKNVYDALAKLDEFSTIFNDVYFADETGYTKIDEIYHGTIEGFDAALEGSVNAKNGLSLSKFHLPFFEETQDLSFEFDATLFGFDINAGISPFFDFDLDVESVLFDMTLTSKDNASFKQILHGTLGDIIDFSLIEGLSNIDIDVDYTLNALADIDLMAKLNIGYDLRALGIDGKFMGIDVPNLPIDLINLGNGWESDEDYLMHKVDNEVYSTTFKIADLTEFKLDLPKLHEHYSMNISNMVSSITTIPSGISFGAGVQSGFTENGTYFVELDSYGKLVNPEKVDKDGDGAKDTYYFSWDIDGNGTSDGAWTNYLYSKFNHDINGNTGEVGSEYRYAQFGGVTLALTDVILGYGLDNYLYDIKLEVINAKVWNYGNESGREEAITENGGIGEEIVGGGSQETALEGSGSSTTSTTEGGFSGSRDFPIALDINRNGDIDYGYLDLTFDNISQKIAWVADGDGVLMWDKYDDGLLHDKSQYVFAKDGLTDLGGLALVFDTNKNNTFDINDELFKDFGVFVDGKIIGLEKVGITSIDLVSNGVTKVINSDVVEYGRAYASLANGEEMLLSDVAFGYQPVI